MYTCRGGHTLRRMPQFSRIDSCTSEVTKDGLRNIVPRIEYDSFGSGLYCMPGFPSGLVTLSSGGLSCPYRQYLYAIKIYYQITQRLGRKCKSTLFISVQKK